MGRKSFTLIEVIVGTVILALAFGGVFTTFVAARSYVERAHERVVAANLGRRALETLYREVRADTWNLKASPLAVNAIRGLPNYNIGNTDYNNNRYRIFAVAKRDYRQANVDITYLREFGAGR